MSRDQVTVERSTPEVLDEALRIANAEGGGVWQFGLVVPQLQGPPPEDDGSFEARAVIMVNAAMGEMRDAPFGSSLVSCLLCQKASFSPDDLPKACTVLAAQCPKPTKFIVHGICRRCFDRHEMAEDLREAIVESYHGMMTPPADASHELGHDSF